MGELHGQSYVDTQTRQRHMETTYLFSYQEIIDRTSYVYKNKSDTITCLMARYGLVGMVYHLRGLISYLKKVPLISYYLVKSVRFSDFGWFRWVNLPPICV